MSNWYRIAIGDFVDFNPTERIRKGDTAKKIPMDKLGTFERKIKGFELAEFNAGPKFRNNDTLVAKITPCLENGKTAYVDLLGEEEIAFGSSEFIVLRANEKSDSKFVYYLARSPIFRERAISCMEGTSGRKRVNERALKRQEILVSDLKTQRKVASFLSVLDDKIELNNKINTELEAMAKLIYDYWFVQFNFPDENGKPYKSSGGKMIWSEELKREIPEGWEVNSVSQFASCNKWSITKSTNFEAINYLDTSSLTRNCIESIQKINPNFEKTPSRAQRIVSKNDILFSTVRPNQCHYGIIKRTIPNLVASSGFAQIRSNDERISNDLLYYFLTSEKIVGRLQQIAETSVSAYPSISYKDILELDICLPRDRSTLKPINNILDSINSTIITGFEENKRLSSLRDWLLPMLMNGQVTISDSKEAEQEVVKPTVSAVKLKTSQPLTPQQENYLKIQYLYTTIWANKTLDVKQGEMATAKDVYLLDRIYGIESGFHFAQHNWGSFDPKEKQLLNTTHYFHKPNFPNSKAFYLDLKDDGKLLNKIPTDLKDRIAAGIQEMNAKVFNRYSGSKKAEKKELFATVLKCIEDTQSLDLAVIRTAMENWKIVQDKKEMTKAEKFSEEETKETLEFIVEEKWHRNIFE